MSNQLILPGMPAPAAKIIHTPHVNKRGYLSVGRVGTVLRGVHRREGRVIWASGLGEMDLSEKEWAQEAPGQPWNHNYLADGGENSALDVWLRAATNPSKYIALLTADPGETGTPATMAENTGTGYARIQIASNNTDWPTLALNGGDYQATAVAKTFTAGGPWSACTHMCLVTSASGTTGALLLVNALGATRTLINTDTLAITLAIKMQ